MKVTAFIRKTDGELVHVDAEGNPQSAYGGPWGDQQETGCIEVDLPPEIGARPRRSPRWKAGSPPWNWKLKR